MLFWVQQAGEVISSKCHLPYSVATTFWCPHVCLCISPFSYGENCVLKPSWDPPSPSLLRAATILGYPSPQPQFLFSPSSCSIPSLTYDTNLSIYPFVCLYSLTVNQNWAYPRAEALTVKFPAISPGTDKYSCREAPGNKSQLSMAGCCWWGCRCEGLRLDSGFTALAGGGNICSLAGWYSEHNPHEPYLRAKIPIYFFLMRKKCCVNPSPQLKHLAHYLPGRKASFRSQIKIRAGK